MDEMQLFLEIHQNMPRQGPGNTASTLKALKLCAGLPSAPRVLDVGCGPGMQTMDLAQALDGPITGVDFFTQYVEELQKNIEKEGMADRVTAMQGDMEALFFPPASFDLIWSEGAIYIMGFEKGIHSWSPLLAPGGYLAVTEATWLKSEPPARVKQFWDEGYPLMKNIEGNLDIIQACGGEIIGHFVLPESAWWDHYYGPLEKRLEILEEKWADNPAGQEVLAMERTEIDLFKNYSDYYGYVFYVARFG
ncbi:Methyltransferase domain-containing protein [Desulfatibacillum alkenivorans DSM 16219]|uniref:Methyltransferase domain-containing protein n=1 Tax=Desulfatibacillum alkenivorans DSM 16219 TaxID=1121393 RepID=A0A1M7BA38_9BACT|nr:class I SAM-dependent methyltransferase [Desulfatibacillum alkenivorans]SHL51813.1 Methyltransferase domain-containing protein [Desulfatibacillum alkenivorans DSM 16219]